MKNNKIPLFLAFAALCSSIPCADLKGKFSLKKVSSLFRSQPYEQVILKKYELDNPSTVIIENIYGNIEIATEWKKNTIFLKATKKAKNQEELDTIQITSKHTKNELTITSNIDKTNTKASVDYQLIVPANITLILTTDRGSITVHDAQGTTSATTTHGDITMYNSCHAVQAQAKESGAILISQACGPITATTKYGNITIQDAKNSIVATTDKGRINTTCLEVPTTSSIDLKTTSGSITLALPSSTSATIYGNTARGTLTSDHYITIKPQTTKLNNSAWNKFKKEVDGILGSGQATITLSSTRGNIKILDTAMG